MPDSGTQDTDAPFYHRFPEATHSGRRGHSRFCRSSDYSNALRTDRCAHGTRRERSRSFPVRYFPREQGPMVLAEVRDGAIAPLGRQICCLCHLHTGQIAPVQLAMERFPAGDIHSFQLPLFGSWTLTPVYKSTVMISYYEDTA